MNMILRFDLLQLLHKYIQYADVPNYLQRMLYGMFNQIKKLSVIHRWITSLFKKQLERELWLLNFVRR